MHNDQDGYKWVVSDVNATKRWALELRGVPGRLTVVDVLRVEYAEDGIDVTGVEKLFTIGSRDGTRPGLAENLLLCSSHPVGTTSCHSPLKLL